jgi:hypothetical protein
MQKSANMLFYTVQADCDCTSSEEKRRGDDSEEIRRCIEIR